MIVEELIEKDYYYLNSKMSFKEAIKTFNDCGQNDLPVVDDGKFLGLVFVDQLKGQEKNNDPISLINDQYRAVYVKPEEKMLVALNKITSEGISTIPVVNDKGLMEGVLLSFQLWNEFAVRSSMLGNGGWVVLTMDQRDYKLSEIAHIVESNGMKVIISFVHYYQGIERIDVHLKVDKENVNELVQTFQRFSYKVTDVIQPEKFTDDWEGKFDELMRFFST